MVNQPAYLVNLKAYGRARYGDGDELSVASAKSLTLDESDRGAMIMAATNLEDMLEYKIFERLPALHTDEVARKAAFEGDGPIASFSRKIQMAYAMGIIDKEYRKLIDLVREVRNTCAHARLPVAADTPEIEAVIKVVIADTLDDIIDHRGPTLRNAFIIKCSILSHYVHSGQKLEGIKAQLEFWASLQRDA